MIDLVIRGGTVIDGSGAPRRVADVAVLAGRISAVGAVGGRGGREVDASGLCVCPGFIDLHTHYDAQYTWDPYATSSIWHGVTTTVIGNCGFAIAPCRPQDREVTLRTLVKVEGMSLKAMQAGITWEFETFPAYLDALERRNPSLNVAALLGHSAVRQWVMGRAAQQRGRPATRSRRWRASFGRPWRPAPSGSDPRPPRRMWETAGCPCRAAWPTSTSSRR